MIKVADSLDIASSGWKFNFSIMYLGWKKKFGDDEKIMKI